MIFECSAVYFLLKKEKEMEKEKEMASLSCLHLTLRGLLEKETEDYD